MVACIIPARGGSKRIKNKNIVIINGLPMVAHAINIAKKSNIFSRIFVSTESKKIQNIAIKYGAKCPNLRPKNLSGDKIPIFKVLKKSLNLFDISEEYICCLYPTALFAKSIDLKKAFKKIVKTKSDFLCSVSKPNSHPLRSYIKRGKTIKYKWPKYSSYMSQDLPIFFNDNGSFSFYKTKMISRATTNNPPLNSTYYEQETMNIDINTDEDLNLAKQLIKKNK